MAAVGVSIPFVYQLFFLVPGYFTYLLAMRVGKILFDFDRFDKLMLSLSASAVSVTIIYGGFVALQSVNSQKGIVTPSPLNLPFSYLAIGFVAHVVLTILGGLLIGAAISCRRDEDVAWQHPWIDLQQELGQNSPSVRVIMSDGDIISGELVGVERSHDFQDIRLEDACIENEDCDLHEEEVYLYGKEIVRVWLPFKDD